MGLFSKTVDYNSILEKVLDGKRFSSNIKSLLLSMIYKVEISYSDYAKVKCLSKTKDEFIMYIISNIEEYFENVKTVEPDSEKAAILRKNKVSAITNELEKSVLSYPTESALLYAISDIESKYFYIENYIFKKELQQLLVEGSNLDVLEVLEDFTGWSWNPKSVFQKNYIANLIYQNLIIMFGMEFIDNCKNSQTKQYDIIKNLKTYYREYYNKLTILLYIISKNKKIDSILEKDIQELKQFSDPQKFLAKNKSRIEAIQKKVDKMNFVLENEKTLNKSFLIKNSKLPEDKKFKTVYAYGKALKKEKETYENQIIELKKYDNPTKIVLYKNQHDLYKEMLESEKTLEDAIIELQQSFIKIIYKKVKEINSRDDFISLIYKIRYYRNIFISKNKAIKDYKVLEDDINKILKKIVTYGVEKEFMKMVSMNVALNYKILIPCLDSKSMELEELRISLDVARKNIFVEVFENKTFEKRFDITFTVDNPEIAIKKKKAVKIFT